MGCDGIAGLGEDADDASGHGGFDRHRTIGGGVAAMAAEGAGIVGLILDAVVFEVEDRVGVAAVEDNAPGAAIDEEREDAGAEEAGVGFDEFSIDGDVPGLCGGLAGRGWGGVDPDLAEATVDGEIEFHGRGFQGV